MGKLINLEGKVFGDWTVLSEEKPGKFRHIAWKCRCICGVVRTVSGNNLRRSGSLGCGCTKKGCRKLPFESIFNTLKREAKDRGYCVQITYEDFLSFTHIWECHYCGTKVWWGDHNVTLRGLNRYNLDRKDNAEGYIKENLVVCCARCNRAKGRQFSYEEFVELGKVIRTFSKQEQHETTDAASSTSLQGSQAA